MERIELIEESPWRWRIARRGPMRVPGVVFTNRRQLDQGDLDESSRQVMNVAALPGIVGASYAMPDVHWGYGFPIGGVAATDVEAGGVVSPGGVGFDISCGVRLLRSQLSAEQAAGSITAVMDALDRRIPSGMGPGGVWAMPNRAALEGLLVEGAPAALEAGFGRADDLDRCEDRGMLAGADPAAVSDRALSRGLTQVGSLGSGNHFLEVQAVEHIHDSAAAAALGLSAGMVCVMIHCGSRGLGHQVCSDHVRAMGRAMTGYGITMPDPQLACVPVRSPEGQAYLAAMAAAANYGRANRHILTHATRQAFTDALGSGSGDLEVVYDVSHNLAKLERHTVEGRERLLCVHRKGATRAFPPHHPELPLVYADTGQPVLVPGSMGAGSWVLAGVAGNPAFASSCHGAGRAMSRHAASRRIRGRTLREQLEASGVVVRCRSDRGLAEEAPFAYKDVDDVVAVCEQAGLARRVARLRPLGVLKG
ncbi:MAG: RtcB family protein [Acidimicrobiales bacterium]